ncbi:MAG: hemolysin D [Proteobacteria bacterium SG_bin9]|nr:MAG: hemolysin D [Proteobacteria bacterium SG_bin9]
MAARDHAARLLRPEPSTEEGASARDAHAETLKRGDEASEPPKVDAPADGASSTQQQADAGAKKPRKRLVFMGLGVAALLAASWYGYHYLTVGRFKISTDDAYVRSYNTTLGARVAGHIVSVIPRDNSQVNAGDVIFKIDDGDYKIAVDSARARVATQEAGIARIGRQVIAAQSQADQAKAQLASADAASTRARLDFERQQALSDRGFASKAVLETSQATRDQSAASVRSAQSALDAANDNVEVIKAQQQEAMRQLDEYKAALAKAERDLGFTSVRAPVDGVFSNRLVNLGDFVAQGQRLANMVPLNEVFIDANYKETQLKRIRVGQPVTISVDAYGHRKFKGTVDSISPAAGSVFTLLPPDNATGNFTKIVQRLPVRVRVPKSVQDQNLLRAGMSVYVTVDTREGAKDADSEADLDDPSTHPQ